MTIMARYVSAVVGGSYVCVIIWLHGMAGSTELWLLRVLDSVNCPCAANGKGDEYTHDYDKLCRVHLNFNVLAESIYN